MLYTLRVNYLLCAAEVTVIELCSNPQCRLPEVASISSFLGALLFNLCGSLLPYPERRT